MDIRDESFFQRICENLAFILVAVDADLRIRFWNHQSERQFHRSAADMIGHPFLDLISDADRDRARRLLESAVQTGSAGEMDVVYVDPERGRLVLVMIVSPIIDADGRRVGASIGMRDISERRRLAKELNKSRRLAA